ncbi:MAG: hypothetical protein IPG60_10890 [Bacteroidetes bacterium]|nr:hypothetical protein [Bacteroidota bacterium]MBP7398543.1 hypothetical protein [Chitinophagales bacterium]MBK7109468.1 hypothetical protein [Bacteroidota bacterium]MBK8487793.1 hypothetical protein [Bacteroidota bacterium]MBK8682452.1 hypothetical protein [Bacteroidota bacterium]
MKFLVSIVFIILFFTASQLQAQVSADKVVGKKNMSIADSIKNSDYPYILPIWGQKVTNKGFELPYSAGLGINYLWQQSDLIIENLQVGFNNGPMYDLDNIVRFDNAQSTASAINIRPDIWVLPFLNVYGIIAKSTPSTDVGYGIYIPDSSGNYNQILSTQTTANFDATSFGFGITPTIGVGGGWIALDMNFTWSDIDALDKPAFAFVFGPRFGKTFRFKKPEQNVAIWVGGFRLNLNSGTNGSLNLSDVIDSENIGANLDDAYMKVEDSQQQIDQWWNGLSELEQNNPLNEAKYDRANQSLETAGQLLDGASSAVNNLTTSTIQYSLDKRPKDKWNFIVGSQYQINKHWMIRGEFGFLGSRQQFIGGLQYRFGL